MKLCCFIVTVFLGNDAALRVTAGTSAEQAQAPDSWFTLNPREEDPAPIVEEILVKLRDALANESDGIDVTTSGQIILKTPAPKAAVARSIGSRAPLINLNTASETDLDTLPGVGPAIASKIVAGRPYSDVNDLRRVDGIGPDKLQRIGPLVTCK